MKAHAIHIKINFNCGFLARDPDCSVLEQPSNQELDTQSWAPYGVLGATKPKKQGCHVSQPQGVQFPSVLSIPQPCQEFPSDPGGTFY